MCPLPPPLDTSIPFWTSVKSQLSEDIQQGLVMESVNHRAGSQLFFQKSPPGLYTTWLSCLPMLRAERAWTGSGLVIRSYVTSGT